MKHIVFFFLLVGFFATIPDSDAFYGEGIVTEAPGQTMDISQNVISPGETMFVNGSFKQPVGDFTTNIFKNYEDSRKLILTLNPTTNEFGDFNFNFTIPEHWELGNYYMILENGLQSMDWGFTVRQNYSGATLDRTVYSVPWVIEPPLKQIKSGITIDEIQCKESLTLVTKNNGSPACVKEQTILKLIERGWATESELKLISESFAIFYAAEERGWTEEDFTTYDSHAILLKIKNDGFAFEVELDTLKEKDLYMTKFNEYDEDQYIWLVSLTENKEYKYHVDAITGKILLVARDGTIVDK